MRVTELHVTFDKALFLTLVLKAKALTELPPETPSRASGLVADPQTYVLTPNTHTSTPRFCGRPSAAANRVPPHPGPFLTCVFSFLSSGFQRDQAEESLCFRTERHFPTSVQPAETPGVHSEFRGAVGLSWHLQRGRGR